MSALSGGPAAPTSAVAEAFGRVKGVFIDPGQSALVLRGAALVFLIRGGGAGLIYLSQVLLARWMEPTQFGIYVYAWSWAILLAFPAGAGFNTASLRFIPEYESRADWSRLAAFVRRAWSVTCLASVAIGVAGSLIILAARGHVAAHYITPLWLAFASVPPLALLALHIDMARGFGWPGLAFAPRLLAAPVLLVAGTVLVIISGAKPTGPLVLVVALVSSLMIAPLQGRAIWARLPAAIRKARPTYETRLWSRVALPLLLASGFHVVLSQTDVIMIGAFLAPDDVAVYYAAAKTAVFVSFVLAAVNAVAAPKLAALYAERRLDDLQTLLSDMSHWIFWPALAAAAAAVLLGAEILTLFGPTFSAGHTALVILVFGHLVRAGTGLVGDLLGLTGHQKLNAWVLALSAVLNVILNTLLIPRFGIAGAAAATAVSMAFWNVGLWLLGRRKLGVDTSIINALRRLRHAPVPAAAVVTSRNHP